MKITGIVFAFESVLAGRCLQGLGLSSWRSRVALFRLWSRRGHRLLRRSENNEVRLVAATIEADLVLTDRVALYPLRHQRILDYRRALGLESA